MGSVCLGGGGGLRRKSLTSILLLLLGIYLTLISYVNTQVIVLQDNNAISTSPSTNNHNHNHDNNISNKSPLSHSSAGLSSVSHQEQKLSTTKQKEEKQIEKKELATENMRETKPEKKPATNQEKKKPNTDHKVDKTEKKKSDQSKPNNKNKGGVEEGMAHLNDFRNASILHDELHDFYATPSDGTNLWDRPNSTLPTWMKRYLNWHKVKVTFLEEGSTEFLQTDRFLVMQCIDGMDNHCGGTSDRLKPLPYALRLAYYTKRLLFIHWTKPCSLTEFLVPPKGGIDWRVPSWLGNALEEDRSIGQRAITQPAIQKHAKSEEALVRMRMQTFHAGSRLYNMHVVEEDNELSFHEVLPLVWHTAFTPSVAVRSKMETEMTDMKLVPGDYTAAHVRVLYGRDSRDEKVTQNWAINAANCASTLRPGKSIFFASDQPAASVYAKTYVDSHPNHSNVSLSYRIPSPNPPLHIDKATGRRPPSDFYDVFVDLYILAMADCVTYNKGGYGLMGLYLSHNSTCGLRQDALDRPTIREPCEWVTQNNVNAPFNTTGYPLATLHHIGGTRGFHSPVYQLERMD